MLQRRREENSVLEDMLLGIINLHVIMFNCLYSSSLADVASHLGPFFASHLYQARATACEGEHLLFAAEHRRRADNVRGQSLQRCEIRTSSLHAENKLTRSSMTERIWSDTPPFPALSSAKI